MPIRNASASTSTTKATHHTRMMRSLASTNQCRPTGSVSMLLAVESAYSRPNTYAAMNARRITPPMPTIKQVLAPADSVIKTAYPGVDVSVVVNPDEAGGVITIRGMSGFPFGSQRVVGWLLRGLEIVGGTNAKVTERNWDAGRIDSDTYELVVSWEGWR